MLKLDAKCYGSIYKAKNNELLSEDQYVVFLAKDNAFAATLPYYLATCKKMGASPQQIKGIEELIERVEQWRQTHPEACKVPDFDEGERTCL